MSPLPIINDTFRQMRHQNRWNFRKNLLNKNQFQIGYSIEYLGTFRSKKCSKMFSKCFHSKKSTKFTQTTYMSRANGKIKQKSFTAKLSKLFFAFCETTKIGGVSYLGRNNTSNFGRYSLNFIRINRNSQISKCEFWQILLDLCSCSDAGICWYFD